LTSRFARWRVRPAHDDASRSDPAEVEWLVVEWPEGAAAPDHYWLSTMAADISLERMLDVAKLRWRIERDYLELKQEVGLGHYEGRGWCGFHYHATLCIAAYGFLISEKETIPPSGPSRLCLAFIQLASIRLMLRKLSNPNDTSRTHSNTVIAAWWHGSGTPRCHAASTTMCYHRLRRIGQDPEASITPDFH